MARSRNLSEKKPKDISLSELRDEIRELTKSILVLSKARQTVSLEIAGIKKESGLDIENTKVERELLSSMADYSERIGLDRENARNLVMSLIESSKTAQREFIYRNEIRSFLESENIERISIAGAGRMGCWFAKYFQNFDEHVIVYDEDQNKAKTKAEEIGAEYASTIDALVNSHLIIVAVPIAKTLGVIREIIQAVQASKSNKALKIIEISSIKNEMGHAGLLDGSSPDGQKVELFSIHPLFGASADSYGNNEIVQVFPKESAFIRSIFPQYKILTLGWREHDKLMSLFLTVPHTLALVFADLLAKQGRVDSVNKGLKTPSFDHMLELSRRVLSENPEVYYEIQASNPFTDEAFSETLSSIHKLRKLLNSRTEFVNFFHEANRIIGIDY
ncbi:MAG: prephenate dehydrogenase/arogenate dehydrogenase family protein [Thaumarchaeota archaeon]|nr:prephenate dehydrogenase/arogenate dehydrogenase family protein [Nitrososphaerota archaeon]